MFRLTSSGWRSTILTKKGGACSLKGTLLDAHHPKDLYRSPAKDRSQYYAQHMPNSRCAQRGLCRSLSLSISIRGATAFTTHPPMQQEEHNTIDSIPDPNRCRVTTRLEMLALIDKTYKTPFSSQGTSFQLAHLLMALKTAGASRGYWLAGRGLPPCVGLHGGCTRHRGHSFFLGGGKAMANWRSPPTRRHPRNL